MSKERNCLTAVLSRMSPAQKVYSLSGATVQLTPVRCVDSRHGRKFSGNVLNKTSQCQQLLNALAGARWSVIESEECVFRVWLSHIRRYGYFSGRKYGRLQRLVLANCHITRVGEALAPIHLSLHSEVR